MALNAVLLQRGRLTHVVRDIAEDFREPNLEAVFALAGALADDDPVVLLLDHGGRRHPIQGPETAGVVMHQKGAVSLEHQKANRLGEMGRQPACGENIATGGEKAHRRQTVLSVSDRPARLDEPSRRRHCRESHGPRGPAGSGCFQTNAFRPESTGMTVSVGTAPSLSA